MSKPQVPGKTYPTSLYGYIGFMGNTTSRETLAANLRRRIEADTPPGSRISIRAWATSKGLDVRLIDRLTKGQHAVTLDNLEKIADACGLKPWHLLIDDLEPGKTPDSPISEDERAMLRKLRRLLVDPAA